MKNIKDNNINKNNNKKDENTTKNKTENKPEKGHYGYVDYTKKKSLIMSIISLASVLIIFFTGVIIYHTNKSLFSIIAAVASLPAAKLITGYIVVRPYKTADKALHNRLCELQQGNTEYTAIIGADFIISSAQKAMSVAFAYIVDGKVICYTEHPKTDAKETERYIKEIFDKEGTQYSQIRVYADEKKFLKAVEDVSGCIGKEYTDKRIFDKLCTYSM